MQSNWASENLQVIRTLMERSALYRRALAPIMLTVGMVGSLAAIVGYTSKINSAHGFIFFWLATSVIGLVGSFLLVRRQALKDKELFWSPPTRRVAHALAPPLLVGLILAVLSLVFSRPDREFPWPLPPWMLPALWMILYGCALHSAGFFMNRGVRVLGWIFILCGLISFWETNSFPPVRQSIIGKVPTMLLHGHICMGLIFGGMHLACGIYLYFTEKKNYAP